MRRLFLGICLTAMSHLSLAAAPSCGALEGLAADAKGMHPYLPGSFYLRSGVRVDLFLVTGARFSGTLQVRTLDKQPVVYWLDAKTSAVYRVDETSPGKASLMAVPAVVGEQPANSGAVERRFSEEIETGCPAR